MVIGPPIRAHEAPELLQDPELRAVLEAVGATLDCTPDEILGQPRTWSRELTQARQIAIYLLQEDFGRPLAEVARLFHRHQRKLGWVHPSIQREIEQRPELAHTVGAIRRKLKSSGEGNFEAALGQVTAKHGKAQAITAQHVLGAVSSVLGISQEQLLEQTRKTRVVRARHLAMYLLRTDLEMSLPQIAKQLERDHTSVLHGCRKMEQDLRRNPGIGDLIAAVRKAYSSGVPLS